MVYITIISRADNYFNNSTCSFTPPPWWCMLELTIILIAQPVAICPLVVYVGTILITQPAALCLLVVYVGTDNYVNNNLQLPW